VEALGLPLLAAPSVVSSAAPSVAQLSWARADKAEAKGSSQQAVKVVVVALEEGQLVVE
jgi:hypothetical protein